MKRRAVPVVLSVVLGVAAAGCGSGDEDAAVEASTAWLVLVDSGQLRNAWSETAQVFQKGVPVEEFEKSIGDARDPLGKLISRKLRSAQAARTLPNSPRGRYVVLQFDSVFENQKNAIETVTEMYEGGQWRVTGYRSR